MKGIWQYCLNDNDNLDRTRLLHYLRPAISYNVDDRNSISASDCSSRLNNIYLLNCYITSTQFKKRRKDANCNRCALIFSLPFLFRSWALSLAQPSPPAPFCGGSFVLRSFLQHSLY